MNRPNSVPVPILATQLLCPACQVIVAWVVDWNARLKESGECGKTAVCRRQTTRGLLWFCEEHWEKND
jgi:hypothetical protein